MPLALKLTLVIGCAVAVGWFIRGAIQDALERIHDWRDPARWAGLGAACIVAVLVLF